MSAVFATTLLLIPILISPFLAKNRHSFASSLICYVLCRAALRGRQYKVPSDRQPLPKLLSAGVSGNLYADRGYISKDLRQILSKQGINLVYKVRKNMKPLPLSVSDDVILKKRVIIESVIKELKTQTQLEHTRHRSLRNFQVNAIAALIAYTYLLKKPTLKLRKLQDIKDLPMSF